MTLRLGLLVNSPSRNTYANVATRFAVGLVETGRVHATLVCYGDDPAPSWLPSEVDIHRLGTHRASHSLPALVRYLRKEQPDVLVTRQVHVNILGLAAAAVARTRPRWHGRLVVAQDHPVELSHASNWRDNKWLVRLGYRYADGVLADSPTVEADVIRWCRLPPASVRLVPLPIVPFTDPLIESPHPWFEDQDIPVFVSTANLMSWKRMDRLIDAFATFSKDHPARLLIIGQGPEQRRLSDQIDSLGLHDRVRLLGWVEDPRQFAARARAFVLASAEEGFSQVLTEAMSVGCPVITTDAMGGGPRFVTDNGRFGVLVPREDRSALIRAMESILDDGLHHQYSKLGLERIAAFSPHACANALVDFLEESAFTPTRERTADSPEQAAQTDSPSHFPVAEP